MNVQEEEQGVTLTFSQTLVTVVSRENELLISIINVVNRRCRSETGMCCTMVGIQIR